MIILVLLFTFSGIFGNNFKPENNAQLNYRQIEFSWPQIPNSNSYELTIFNTESDFTHLIESNDNILIYDGYNLNWGESYNWMICGYSNNILTECHEDNFFQISNLPIDELPAILEIEYIDNQNILEGITIISGHYQQSYGSFAIDNNGEILWFLQNKKVIKMISNGNFLHQDPHLWEISLDGQIIFESNSYDNENNFIHFHHSIDKTENNTYFGIIKKNEVHLCPSDDCQSLVEILFPNGVIWKGDSIVELDQSGNIIWEWNLFDRIGVESYNPWYTYNLGPGNDYSVDWTHTNEVLFDNNTNSVFISIRNLNTITKIDYESKEVIWHLGDLDTLNNNAYFNQHPTFNHQHTPIFKEDGNLIVFNNGSFDNNGNLYGISSCQEYAIDEINGNINLIWEYILPDTLYTGARGDCVPLKNGNVLIETGQTANFIELNSNNEIVWHGVVESTLGANFLVRIMKLDNLYPSSFNIIFDNYVGLIENPVIYLNNQQYFSFNIINNGWNEDTYNINIYNDTDLDFNTTLEIDADSMVNHTIPLSELNLNNFDADDFTLNFSVIPTSNPVNEKNYTLNFISNINDINGDGFINVIDIIEIINCIIDSIDCLDCDINYDDQVNILDIMILIDIITN